MYPRRQLHPHFSAPSNSVAVGFQHNKRPRDSIHDSASDTEGHDFAPLQLPDGAAGCYDGLKDTTNQPPMKKKVFVPTSMGAPQQHHHCPISHSIAQFPPSTNSAQQQRQQHQQQQQHECEDEEAEEQEDIPLSPQPPRQLHNPDGQELPPSSSYSGYQGFREEHAIPHFCMIGPDYGYVSLQPLYEPGLGGRSAKYCAFPVPPVGHPFSFGGAAF